MSVTTERSDVAAFTEALDEFQRSWHRARGRFNGRPVVPELSASQYKLLEPLADAGEQLCVGQIATAAGVSPPSATRMLDGLEERGFVERVRGEGDRRIVEVDLTDRGRELVLAKRARILAARTEIFDRLGPTDRDAAPRLLQSLAAAIEELNP